MTATTLDRPAPVSEESPLEQRPPKRLSDALRRGARLHPQGRGALYRNGRTCALGAILADLLGPEHVEKSKTSFAPMYPPLVRQKTGVDLEQPVRVPHQDGDWTLPSSLWGAIMYLNDTAYWTREQIADWLQSMDL